MGVLNVAFLNGHDDYDLSVFELNESNAKRLDFLIKNKDDYLTFLNKFWNGSKNQFFSICAFRNHKIEALNITYTQFLKHFHNNEIASLEFLFQHPVKESHLRILHKRINEKKLTLEALFAQHKEDPEYPLQRHIL